VVRIDKIISEHLRKECETIYSTRLDAVMDVAMALQRSNDLSLTRMGRKLAGETNLKHKIKKVDRLEGNKHLHSELNTIYEGLSSYVMSLVSQVKSVPIVVDLCYVKDDGALQMLSAEIATKGRTVPLYREVFEEGSLKRRAKSFLNNLSKCIPEGKEVVVIMDAGFFEDWFKEIELLKWHWICRVKQGRSLKFAERKDWIGIKDFIAEVGTATKNYKDVLLTKAHKHGCRIITTNKKNIHRKRKETASLKKRRKVGSKMYLKSAKEPWVLATNLPEIYKGVMVVNFYKKRMQIEESFRDMKSHQFGLCGRYIRTTNVDRWGVKMLLAAIVQITFWVIGIIGHQQGMQRYFQANTVKDKKIFSNFTLGQLIIEHNKLGDLKIDYQNLPKIIQMELANA
jgi:hypothetical protein